MRIMGIMGVMGIMLLAGCGDRPKPTGGIVGKAYEFGDDIGRDVEQALKTYTAANPSEYPQLRMRDVFPGMYDPARQLLGNRIKNADLEETYYWHEFAALCQAAREKKTVPSALVKNGWIATRLQEMNAANSATRADWQQVQKAAADKAAQEKQAADDKKYQTDERLKRIGEPVTPGR